MDIQNQIIQFGYTFYEQNGYQFKEFNHPSNVIDLYAIQPDNSGCITFLYDRDEKQIADLERRTEQSRVDLIRLPFELFNGKTLNDEQIDALNMNSKNSRGYFHLIKESERPRIEGELRKFEYAGIVFEVDINNDSLFPENCGSYLQLMPIHRTRDGFSFDYDKDKRCFPKSNSWAENIVRINAPELVSLDPIGMSEKFEMNISRLPQKDSELATDERLIRARRHGKLPTVAVGQYVFVVDLRLGEIRDTKMQQPIRFEDMHDNDRDYEFYLDTKNMQLAKLPRVLKELPKNVIHVRIPPEKVLDPIYYHKGLKADTLKQILKTRPVRMHHRAIITAVHKTPLQLEVNEYKQKQLQSKPQKRKRGNGIK